MSNPRGPRLFDPICGTWLDPSEVATSYTFLRETYVFCCCECRDLFVRAPEYYVTLLAHEPLQSAGHRCPHQCQAAAEGAHTPSVRAVQKGSA